ncbi:MAG: phytoene desaturase family protein [Microscillaceae bacterium]|nr:phytoene desaturase family protein [Microscillaceae bacterium]MDW8459944.1 phytoene desaturase family protein [Cytophagales bacterium]
MPSFTKKIVVIGAGFAGMSAATFLAQKGYEVSLLEKHAIAGGRARMFESQGFRYDMGPSWYWMPDVFERYFAQFGKRVSDYYELVRLNPSYRIIFGENDIWNIPAYMHEFSEMLERIEAGSSKKLAKFLAQAAYKYRVGIQDLVYKPSRSIWEFADSRLLVALFHMDVFQSMHTHVRRFFKNPKIIQLMEFPILFLGALPENTPALYSLMNYADIILGTWYPIGGMYEIVKAMQTLAQEQGVRFYFNQDVKQIAIRQGKAYKVITQTNDFEADVVVVGADYHHAETNFLPPEYQSYSEKYWASRILAPSCLIFYVGLNKKLKNVLHHNLFFDTDFMQHAHEIYTTPRWPQNPLFYVSVPSVTDESVAPRGCENLFFLIPTAHDLEDKPEIREHYFKIIIDRFERITGENIRQHIVFQRSYAHNDFKNDYNAFKGNAYGLANTLTQTAILKPSLKSKKVKNLFYTGQLTVPGPGVPPSLISGEVVAKEIAKEYDRWN